MPPNCEESAGYTFQEKSSINKPAATLSTESNHQNKKYETIDFAITKSHNNQDSSSLKKDEDFNDKNTKEERQSKKANDEIKNDNIQSND